MGRAICQFARWLCHYSRNTSLLGDYENRDVYKRQAEEVQSVLHEIPVARPQAAADGGRIVEVVVEERRVHVAVAQLQKRVRPGHTDHCGDRKG